MEDDVIPLNEIGKIETVKVYNQSYVNKQQKRIAELEEKISILLSCKNCPDNKGGLLCQKEYEDKCLAQKIQYIKELEKESVNLKALRKYELNVSKLEIEKLEKENAELKELVEKYRQAVNKCLHITFMGGGCEVNTIGQYATLVDGYLTDVEGLARWKN